MTIHVCVERERERKRDSVATIFSRQQTACRRPKSCGWNFMLWAKGKGKRKSWATNSFPLLSFFFPFTFKVQMDIALILSAHQFSRSQNNSTGIFSSCGGILKLFTSECERKKRKEKKKGWTKDERRKTRDERQLLNFSTEFQVSPCSFCVHFMVSRGNIGWTF